MIENQNATWPKNKSLKPKKISGHGNKIAPLSKNITQRDRKLGFAARSKKTGCMVKNKS